MEDWRTHLNLYFENENLSFPLSKTKKTIKLVLSMF